MNDRNVLQTISVPHASLRSCLPPLVNHLTTDAPLLSQLCDALALAACHVKHSVPKQADTAASMCMHSLSSSICVHTVLHCMPPVYMLVKVYLGVICPCSTHPIAQGSYQTHQQRSKGPSYMLCWLRRQLWPHYLVALLLWDQQHSCHLRGRAKSGGAWGRGLTSSASR